MPQSGPSPDLELTLDQARRAAIDIQGLHGSTATLPETLEATGFIRTLGGADVYIAARSRFHGLTREQLDSEVEARRLHVGPTVRGCIYLVAESHVSASLTLADALSRKRAEREQQKAGIRAGELDALGREVVEILKDGPLTTQSLRRRLPQDAVRSLGDAGKKVGISSPLPPTLRRLEFDRVIERSLENGRLDTERYLWRLAPEGMEQPDPDPASIHRHFAEIYLRTAGFGTRKGFAAWSGLGQRDAQKALDGLETFPLGIEGFEEPFVALAELRDRLASPRSDQIVAFLPMEDNLLAFREGPAFFVDPEHHHIPVPVWGRGRGSNLGDVRHAALRPIMAGHRMVGFWELDPDAGRVVTGLFAQVSSSTQDQVQDEADRLGTFLTQDIGHGRSISIDSEASQRKRCALLKQLTH